VAIAAGAVKKYRLPAGDKTSWWDYLGRHMDIRLLLVGSLLPDIIDKPVGIYLFPQTFGDGRIFSHTLLFFLVIALAGLFLFWKKHQTWMLALAAGTFMHLVLDEMWLAPHVLFWPLFGFAFERGDIAGWLTGIFNAMFSRPSVYIPEIIGFIIVLWFGMELLVRHRVALFLKHEQAG